MANKEFKQKIVGDSNEKVKVVAGLTTKDDNSARAITLMPSGISRLRRENLSPNARFTKDVNRH